jgi:hypothetical protein
MSSNWGGKSISILALAEDLGSVIKLVKLTVSVAFILENRLELVIELSVSHLGAASVSTTAACYKKSVNLC